MMTFNHALAGMLFGYIIAVGHPDLLVPLAIAGWIGGFFPDIDAKLVHRKTLHFPVYYSVISLILLILTVHWSSALLVIGLSIFGSAAFHCLADYFVTVQKNSDKESPEGVLFIHPVQKWVGPKEVLRYAGSPEDLAMGLVLGGIAYFVFSGLLLWLAGVTLLGSILYFTQRQWKRRR